MPGSDVVVSVSNVKSNVAPPNEPSCPDEPLDPEVPSVPEVP